MIRAVRSLILAALAGPLTLAATSAPALELSLPAQAEMVGEVKRNPDSYRLPVGAYAQGVLPTKTVEGRVRQQAWRIGQSDATTLDMIRGIRDQLASEDYEIILDCDARACGGFDFRFNTRIMPAPDMHIDLFDFRFLSARKLDAATKDEISFVSAIVSRSGGAGYIQIILVTPDGQVGDLDVRNGDEATRPLAPSGGTTLDADLSRQGHVILKDLDFGTGSSNLGPGPYASLKDLAAFLNDNSERRVALVGHTDLVGSLEDNVALSRKRAYSVLERLIGAHGVSRDQLEAHGIGYLAPLSPNHTTAGRDENRRVEAVLLNAK